MPVVCCETVLLGPFIPSRSSASYQRPTSGATQRLTGTCRCHNVAHSAAFTPAVSHFEGQLPGQRKINQIVCGDKCATKPAGTFFGVSGSRELDSDINSKGGCRAQPARRRSVLEGKQRGFCYQGPFLSKQSDQECVCPPLRDK